MWNIAPYPLNSEHLPIIAAIHLSTTSRPMSRRVILGKGTAVPAWLQRIDVFGDVKGMMPIGFRVQFVPLYTHNKVQINVTTTKQTI